MCGMCSLLHWIPYTLHLLRVRDATNTTGTRPHWGEGYHLPRSHPIGAYIQVPLPFSLWVCTIFCNTISRFVLPFWYQFTRVVLDKGLLNRCSVIVVWCCGQRKGSPRKTPASVAIAVKPEVEIWRRPKKWTFWPWFPIHSFRHFFAMTYRFATIQNVTDRWQADRQHIVPKARPIVRSAKK